MSHDSFSHDVRPKDPRQLITECPMCKALYAPEQLVSVYAEGTTDIFHCLCSTCGSALLATIHKSAIGMSILGVMTDLSGDESLRLLSADSLSEEDLFYFHTLLTHHSEQFMHALR